MDDFIRNNYTFLYKCVEILAAIAGIIAWRKYRQTPVRFFILFLIYVVIIEFIGNYPRFLISINKSDILEGTLIERNSWWYTFMWAIGSSLFFLFFYSKVLKTPLFKKILKYLFYGVVSVVIIQLLLDYTAFYGRRPFYISVLNLLVIVICALFYFVEILMTERILKFQKSVVFYISVVILIWFLVNTPLVFFNHHFRREDGNYVLLRYQIVLFSNIFMYSTFAFSLLWCKPQND